MVPFFNHYFIMRIFSSGSQHRKLWYSDILAGSFAMSAGRYGAEEPPGGIKRLQKSWANEEIEEKIPEQSLVYQHPFITIRVMSSNWGKSPVNCCTPSRIFVRISCAGSREFFLMIEYNLSYQTYLPSN